MGKFISWPCLTELCVYVGSHRYTHLFEVLLYTHTHTVTHTHTHTPTMTHTHTVNETVANFDGLSSDDILKLVDEKTFLSES